MKDDSRLCALRLFHEASCHIGIALLTALPVSTGRARTLSRSEDVQNSAHMRLAYFLPASVAQQQQIKDAGQQTICT